MSATLMTPEAAVCSNLLFCPNCRSAGLARARYRAIKAVDLGGTWGEREFRNCGVCGAVV